MISQETVWAEIWPVVQALLEATQAEADEPVTRLLVPDGEAANLYDLFGPAVFDLLLKRVLGRSELAITRAIQTEKGRYVHIEFVWPDPDAEDGSYSAADLVTVQLEESGARWRILAVNPAAADLPLTEARARGVLVAGGARSGSGELPRELWILPVALLAGTLQLTLRKRALADEVEKLLLPGLQARHYGALSLVGARRLWRDFRGVETPALAQPAAWAAAAEFIIGEQSLREVTQASVGEKYRVSLSRMLPRIRQIKNTLNIRGLDERYTSLGGVQIVLADGGDSVSS